MRYIIFLFLISLSISLVSQESKVRLAYQYYQNKEFEKAAVLFEELYKKNKTDVYFTYTVNCLVELKSYEKAEKLIKKGIKRDKRKLQNYIELGYLYKIKENVPEAEKQFNYVLRNLPAQKNGIIRVANSFL